MMRAVFALWPLAFAALAAAPARAETAVECESKTNGGDYYEIACPLRAEGAAEWRFRAHFDGVHDDSAAYLKASVDDREVTCGPGSAMKLLGEGDEGAPGSESYIECRLAVDGRAGAEQRLFLVLTWKHAQHTGHELVAVPRH